MDTRAVLERQEECGYAVYAPSLPGCVSQGETREDALKNIKETIGLYLDVDENELVIHEGENAVVLYETPSGFWHWAY